MPPAGGRVSFKRVALSLVFLSLFVAALNLYMNLIASYSMPSLQLDLSAEGDVIGFHHLEDAPPGGSRVAPEVVIDDDPNRVIPQPNTFDPVKLDGLKRAPHPLMIQRIKAIEKIRNGGKEVETYKQTTVAARPCPGICPPIGSTQSQSSYINSLINQQLSKVSRNSFNVEMGEPLNMQNDNPNNISEQKFKSIWDNMGNLVKERSIFPTNASLEDLTFAVKNAKIFQASIPKKGTQLKAFLVFEGDQSALFKPQMYSRDAIMSEDTPYSGADRHNGEIAAFHISRFLGLDRVPVVIGRKVKLKDELMAAANSKLAQTFFVNTTSTEPLQCFYGECMYCNISNPACADKDGYLEGAIVLWLPPAFSRLRRIRSPWARTYNDSKVPAWSWDLEYCSKVMAHEFFGRSKIFLDLIDMAVFDWLIGNADRHRYSIVFYSWNINCLFVFLPVVSKKLEVFSEYESMILLLDNGKSFGNAKENFDEITILTPLFQCCKIRRQLYDNLIKLSEENFGEVLNLQLKTDPLYPILTKQHLSAVNRRVRKVLVVLSICLETHGSSKVIVDE